MASILINFVATLFSPPNCSFDLSVTCSVTNVARRGSLSLSHTNRAMYIQWIPQHLWNYFCTPIVLRANDDSFFLLLLDVQIIKVSTTAQEETTISSLRGHRRRRPKPRSISPLYPPQVPQGHPLEVWTTHYRATTLPARCSASLISCPTTQGTLPVQNLESQGHCTASHLRCLAPVLPLPHCHWMAADITTTCPTRPRKWTRAQCGSFLRERTLLARDLLTEGGGVFWCWARIENRDMDIDRVRATPLSHYFFGVLIFIYLFYHKISWSFCGNTVRGIKIMLTNIVFSVVFGCFHLFLLRILSHFHPAFKTGHKKNWARLLTCASFFPFLWALGAPCHSSWLLSWPSITTKSPTLTSGVENNPFEISYSMSQTQKHH